MVPPQRYENEQYVEEMKSREPTRSKSHESMRSDRMTQRGVTQGQVDSKSFIVPHHRRSEGAATQQRPGASTSSTSPALHSILACLLVCFAYGQGEAPGYIATIALAFWTVFPSACAVAAASQYTAAAHSLLVMRRNRHPSASFSFPCRKMSVCLPPIAQHSAALPSWWLRSRTVRKVPYQPTKLPANLFCFNNSRSCLLAKVPYQPTKLPASK